MEPEIKHFERPTTNRPPSLVSVAIVSALVGLATGAAGFTVMNAWYPPSSVIPGGQLPGTSIKYRIEEPFTVAAANLLTQVAGIYEPVANDPVLGSPLYTDKDYLGNGLVVTSDGWIMLAPDSPAKATIQAVLGDKVWTSTDYYQDPLTGLKFYKIPAQDLNPVKFAGVTEAQAGSVLLSAHNFAGLDPVFDRFLLTQANTIDTSSKASVVHSSGAIESWHVVDHLPRYASTFYFTLSGSTAGMQWSGRVLPAYYLQTAVNKMLNRTPYATLGISYVDNYRLPGRAKEPGVILYGAKAVLPDSPAAKAGLQTGDIIVSVDNTEIDFDAGLMQLLINYKPGDVSSLKVLRNNEQLTIPLTF